MNVSAVSAIRRFFAQEDVNFLLCNRIPRRLATLCMGWYSGLANPWVVRASMRAWQSFGDLDLSDARQRDFRTLQECFTRELVPGARPVDPDPVHLCSPSDAIVGACGTIAEGIVLQAKGFPYRIDELFGPSQDTRPFRDGVYATLRPTSGMYHRFHAPHDCTVEHATYLSGDTWNVNPVALARVERLFCRNERAVLRLRLAGRAGAGGGDPGRRHPAELRRRAPAPALPRAERAALRRTAVEGRRDGILPARLDHPRVRAARLRPLRRHRTGTPDQDG